MTRAQRDAMRDLAKDKRCSEATGDMIADLLARLDDAERLLGEAVRVLQNGMGWKDDEPTVEVVQSIRAFLDDKE